MMVKVPTGIRQGADAITDRGVTSGVKVRPAINRVAESNASGGISAERAEILARGIEQPRRTRSGQPVWDR